MKKYKVYDFIILKDFVEKFMVVNKHILLLDILDCSLNESFNFYLYRDNEIFRTYKCEKINWNDSIMVLIGGNGYKTFSCFCENETNGESSNLDEDIVLKTLDKFLKNEKILESDILLISK